MNLNHPKCEGMDVCVLSATKFPLFSGLERATVWKKSKDFFQTTQVRAVGRACVLIPWIALQCSVGLFILYFKSMALQPSCHHESQRSEDPIFLWAHQDQVLQASLLPCVTLSMLAKAITMPGVGWGGGSLCHPPALLWGFHRGRWGGGCGLFLASPQHSAQHPRGSLLNWWVGTNCLFCSAMLLASTHKAF